MNIDRSEFVDALTAAKRVCRSDANNPILGCVQLASDGGALSVEASNRDTSVRCYAPSAGVLDPVLVPVGRLLAAAKAFRGDEVTCDVEDNALHLSNGTSTVSMPTLDGRLPSFPNDECTDWYDSEEFFDAVGRVAHATAQDPHKPICGGIHIVSAEGKTVVEAFDTYRAARQVIGDAVGVGESIVPLEALDVVRTAFRPGDKLGWLVQENGNAKFSVPAAEVSTRCIAGQFPPINRLLRTDHGCSALVTLDDFNAAIKVARAAIPDRYTPIRIDVVGGSMMLSARTPDGDFSYDLASVTPDATDYVIGVSATYLFDLANAFSGKGVFFGFPGDPSSHIVVTDPSDPGFTAIVMSRSLS